MAIDLRYQATLEKLNCTLPSSPASGQRRRRAVVPMTARARQWTYAILINARLRHPTGFHL